MLQKKTNSVQFHKSIVIDAVFYFDYLVSMIHKPVTVTQVCPKLQWDAINFMFDGCQRLLNSSQGRKTLLHLKWELAVSQQITGWTRPCHWADTRRDIVSTYCHLWTCDPSLDQSMASHVTSQYQVIKRLQNDIEIYNLLFVESWFMNR